MKTYHTLEANIRNIVPLYCRVNMNYFGRLRAFFSGSGGREQESPSGGLSMTKPACMPSNNLKQRNDRIAVYLK